MKKIINGDMITIDAKLKDKSKKIIKEIYVWKQYGSAEKGISGRLKHKQKVEFLEQIGVSVKIRFGKIFKKTGYIHFWFIKELNHG